MPPNPSEWDRAAFDAEMKRREFKGMVEDIDDDHALQAWTKACFHGCPFQQHRMDARIYDPVVLGLLMHRIAGLDCGHPGDGELPAPTDADAPD